MIFIRHPLLPLLLLLSFAITCLAQLPLDGCPMIESEKYTSEILSVEFTTYDDNYTLTSAFEGVAHINNIPEESIRGLLLEPKYAPTGCDVSDYGHVPAEDWVAIVQNGSCDYSTQGQVAISLGAKALIIYELTDDDLEVIANISANISAVVVPRNVGLNYTEMLQDGEVVNVTIHTVYYLPSARRASGAKENTLLIVLASIMCPAAILLNAGALIAIIYYPEKPKPHLYLIANLIIADLLVAVIGTLQICLLYPLLADGTDLSMEAEVYIICITHVLSEVWGLAMFSNLFTLLSLTTEHFIAFRWPIKHKIVVTRQRVLSIIALQWLLAAAPMTAALVKESLRPSLEHCPEESFCRRSYYFMMYEPDYTWVRSLPCVFFVAVVLAVMILVYGYVMVIVHRVSVRNPGFRKKGTAMVTTSCLIVSFFLSYTFYFIDNFSRIVLDGEASPFTQKVGKAFSDVCPMCPLILDFLITGMIGAIMDPIIYCMRMKEVKSACNKVCKGRWLFRHVSLTSGGGYTRAVQHSVTVDEHL